MELRLHKAHPVTELDNTDGRFEDEAVLPHAADGVKPYSLFDDDEVEDWQQEPDDWWQQGREFSSVPEEEAYDAVNPEGESVQAALNSRLRRTTKLTFFDDESGEE